MQKDDLKWIDRQANEYQLKMGPNLLQSSAKADEQVYIYIYVVQRRMDE